MPLPRRVVSEIPAKGDNQPRPDTRQPANRRRPRTRGRTAQTDNTRSLQGNRKRHTRTGNHARPRASTRGLRPPVRHQQTRPTHQGTDEQIPPLGIPLTQTPPADAMDEQLLRRNRGGIATLHSETIRTEPTQRIRKRRLTPALKDGACAANLVNQALAFERKQERKHVARVFAELGIDRQKAINLLVFEWDTDRRDAEELMLEAHRIYWPLERLKRHLRNEDWTMSEISDFLHDYEVARQLRTNRRLSDLTAAGLVDWLQKNQD